MLRYLWTGWSLSSNYTLSVLIHISANKWILKTYPLYPPHWPLTPDVWADSVVLMNTTLHNLTLRFGSTHSSYMYACRFIKKQPLMRNQLLIHMRKLEHPSVRKPPGWVSPGPGNEQAPKKKVQWKYSSEAECLFDAPVSVDIPSRMTLWLPY